MATKTPTSETISFTAPSMMKMEISAIPKTGYYDSSSEFLRDAIRSLLRERNEIRIAIASVLYKEKKISLGKAVEISGTNYDEMKKLLAEKGIKRHNPTKKEVIEGLERYKKWKKKKSS